MFPVSDVLLRCGNQSSENARLGVALQADNNFEVNIGGDPKLSRPTRLDFNASRAT